MASMQLSPKSIYEQLFGTRRRSVGRPSGDTEPLFATVDGGNVDEVRSTVAKRRAYAVVHEENRDRLQAVYAAELAVLKRRPVEQVAADAGIKMKVEG